MWVDRQRYRTNRINNFTLFSSNRATARNPYRYGGSPIGWSDLRDRHHILLLQPTRSDDAATNGEATTFAANRSWIRGANFGPHSSSANRGRRIIVYFHVVLIWDRFNVVLAIVNNACISFTFIRTLQQSNVPTLFDNTVLGFKRVIIQH